MRLKMPAWNSPLVLSALGALLYGVASDLIAGWVRENAADGVGDFLAWAWSPLVVLLVLFAVLWGVQEAWPRERGGDRAPNDPLSGSITPRGDHSLRKILADSDEAKWKRAAIAYVTWLYRRDEWGGLSQEGRVSEAAPEDYARKRLAHVGGDELNYDPAAQVGPEPWWQPPTHELVAVGGTTTTCSCGWRGPGHEFVKHAGLPPSTPPIPLAPLKSVPWLPPTLASVPGPGREPFLNEMRETHARLFAQLHEKLHAMWQVRPDDADYEEGQQWDALVQPLLIEAETYAVTYWNDRGLLAGASSAARSPAQLPPPGPKWRTDLTLRVEHVTAWLAAHPPPPEMTPAELQRVMDHYRVTTEGLLVPK